MIFNTETGFYSNSFQVITSKPGNSAITKLPLKNAWCGREYISRSIHVCLLLSFFDAFATTTGLTLFGWPISSSHVTGFLLYIGQSGMQSCRRCHERK